MRAAKARSGSRIVTSGRIGTIHDQTTQMLESITDGFIAVDSEWCITRVNAEAGKILDIPRDQMISRNHWDLFPAGVGTFMQQELWRALETSVPVDFESHYEPWDRWFHFRALPAAGGGLSIFFRDITAQKLGEEERAGLLQLEKEARAEAEELNRISRMLAGERDAEKLVQEATDTATRLTGASFGAFFYNAVNEGGERYRLYTLSGAPREKFEKFGFPRNTPIFGPTFRGTRIVRSADITQDPNYGSMTPHNGMPNGHLPVKSYLAVPVVSRTGEVLGGLFFGHPEPGVFTERAERVAGAIAGHAAIAIDNARLFEKFEHEARERNRTEELLRQSEKRLRQMIDALPAAVYTTDVEGRLANFNRSAEGIAGRTPEPGTAGWWISSKVFTSDGTELPVEQCFMPGNSDGGIVNGREYIGERADGSRFWFTATSEPLFDDERRDDGGRVDGHINILVNITERKRAEEAVRESEERFRAIFETTPECVKIVSADGTLIHMNAAGVAMLGASSLEELAGKSVYDFIAPEFREQFRAFNESVCRGTKGTLEFEIIGLNGERRQMETRAAPFRNPDGTTAQLAVSRDVSERKARAREIRLLAAIVDSSDDAIISKDLNGIITSWNRSAQRVFGYTAEEAIGKPITILIPQDRLDEEPRILASLRRGEGIDHFETIRRHKEGTLLNVSLTISPVKDGSGRIIGASKIARDVTEIRRTERASLLLAAIVDSSDDAVISKDLNGIITSWNNGARRVFGYTAEEVVGKPVTILIPPDRWNEEPNILARIRRGERVEHFETVRRRKDGTLLDISLTISPIKDASGKIIGASKIARDMTDRKRGEEATRRLNEHLAADLSATTRMQHLSTRLLQADNFEQLLYEILDAGIEITGSEKGNIQLFENGALKIVAQRGFGSEFLEFFGGGPHTETACGMAFERGERVVVEDVTKSPIFTGTPGLEAMLAAGARSVQSTPLISRSGRVLGLFSTHSRMVRKPSERNLRLLDLLARQAADLIERKLAEEALAAGERRLGQLADSMPQIVWTADPHGEMDYFNERWYEFSGFGKDRFGTESWTPIMHPDDLERTLDQWKHSISTGEPYRIEHRFWDRHEKRWRWFMGQALAIRGESGAITKWFGTSTDIDEQKRVEDELRRANQDLEQFAYSASHDLQEPLRSIKIYGELLTSRYGKKLDGQALEFLKYLHTGAIRMEVLVRDLLAYTQITRPQEPAEEVDANEVLEATLATLDVTIRASGASITSEPLPRIGMHETHLGQLFQNLIGNAVKYRSPDRAPEVHISGKQESGYCRISIRDNGIGIESAYKELIFGLFKRLHTGDEYSGTGIGLAICQRIVERYSGRIWVESQPGRGSNFVFTVPI